MLLEENKEYEEVAKYLLKNQSTIKDETEFNEIIVRTYF